MTVAVEEKRVRSLFERVEAVEEVAGTLADDDERCYFFTSNISDVCLSC